MRNIVLQADMDQPRSPHLPRTTLQELKRSTVPSNDNQQYDPKSARTGSVWVDDCHARRVAAAFRRYCKTKSIISSPTNANLFGIPNFWNVVSNLPFIAVGAAGLLRFRRDATTTVLFSGIFLTGFGSSYYHLNPNDATLFWDRLPMTLCFAAILAAVVEERVDAKAGRVLLRPLLAIGIFSLLLWRWTDDLRLYAWAQFFPFLALGDDPPTLPAEVHRRVLLGHRCSALRARQSCWNSMTMKSFQLVEFLAGIRSSILQPLPRASQS